MLLLMVAFVLPVTLIAQQQVSPQKEPNTQKRSEVLLETTEGNIRIALYDETPLHRDNFLKLVRLHVFDSLLFHRVIKDFMIQGGDLNSKHAMPGQLLGTGELDYTIEPEFRLPQIKHRRGVVAAARQGDDVNPEMRSGACQFYIVWDNASHLDGKYTVFGEVVEGLEVVDSIQRKPTDANDRPLTDVRILRATEIVAAPPVSDSTPARGRQNVTRVSRGAVRRR